MNYNGFGLWDLTVIRFIKNNNAEQERILERIIMNAAGSYQDYKKGMV